MKHVKITAFDIPDAWIQCLGKIYFEGDSFQVGFGSEEVFTKKLAVSVEITHPANRPLVHEKCANDTKYLSEYFFRYLWGVDNLPHWGKTNTEHYTYAQRMREPIDQIEAAIRRMVEQPADRQIVLTVARPEDILKRYFDEVSGMEKFEPPCLRSLHLEHQDGCINLYTDWRSWDCVGGFPSNIAGLQLWLEEFTKEVSKRAGKDYKTGKQICNSKNLHIYQRSIPWVEENFFKTQKDSRRVFT